jgi:Rad3-related DNA helicase
MMLAEAGTGVGKTLGYLAPASLWAEANGPSVWVSTYTRALQRQIERESHSIYPDPKERARKAVVRKGRENYLCLLNFQEQINGAQLGNGDLIGLALATRWARATRDGDMTGGDFPAWLPTLSAVPPSAQAGPVEPGRSARRMYPRRLPALSHLLHRKGRAGVQARRHRHRQPRPGADPGRLRRRADGARA